MQSVPEVWSFLPGEALPDSFSCCLFVAVFSSVTEKLLYRVEIRRLSWPLRNIQWNIICLKKILELLFQHV